MKRLLILCILSLCLHTAIAQQFKTSQGITTVTVVKPEPAPPKPKKPKKTFEVKRGFEQYAELGISPLFEDDHLFISANYIAGYRFNKTFFVGGGTGVELMTDEYTEYTLPIFAHARVYFGKGRWQPFVALSVGGRFCLNYDHNYGSLDKFSIYLNPSVGVNYMINNKLGINFRAGWQLVEHDNYHDKTGVTFNIGLTF